ncbi:MAG TPA: potassium channel family protein [Candidatus Saccharimonadales bacterium]|nr:potassium channel family protein [Candidatus Saccharimonadales bacterium]
MDDHGFTGIEQEYRSVHRRYRLTFLAAVVLIAGGAVVYHSLLHLSWVNAFYFCTVTLGTVGYGDITPNTDTSKIFTIFYILAGVGIIATFANLLVKNASLRREFRKARRDLKE